MKTVDIVVPCFNEAEVVETFLAETERICGQIAGYRFS